MDKKPTPTTFVNGPQAPTWPPAGGVLSSAGPSWPPAGMVPCSRPANADIDWQPSDDREAVSTVMLGIQSTTTSSRQERRSQNTYEDRPAELQQHLPHSVHASSRPTERSMDFRTPLHDEHQRLDQLYAQRRAQHSMPYAPTFVPAATAHSEVNVTSTAATSARPDLAPCRSRSPRRASPPRDDLASSHSGAPHPAALPRPDMAPCLSRTFDACSQAPTAHQQHDDLQPTYGSAAGGRGSSSAPPVGPVDDQSVEDEYEATSAFYCKATFHRAAPGSTPSPLILEELPIEPFDGDIRRYPMFRNRFLDVVEGHRKMPPRHKLQYLLQFLRGEPLQLSNNYQLTDANYYIIVDRLEEQYGDDYRLRQLLAQDFIAMRPPARSVADLRRFHDVAFRITTDLQTLGENIDGTVLYEQTLMAKLPMKLKEEIVRNSEYSLKRTATSILDGLRKYVNILDKVSNCGILFGPPAPAAPEATCQEQRPPSARSPSECSAEESTECSKDTSAEQPTACVASAALPEILGILQKLNKRTEAQWRCQLCGQPHAAANCTTYATVVKRLRRIKKLGLCLH